MPNLFNNGKNQLAEQLTPNQFAKFVSRPEYYSQGGSWGNALAGLSTLPVVGEAMDAWMYATDPESRTWQNYLLTAAGMVPGLPAASAAKKVKDKITAYHGSPHDFPPVRELRMPDGAEVYQRMDDAIPEGAEVLREHPLGRFDMSKIGTGEGAQAYGHGLYFADSEDVARGYQERLSGNPASMYGELRIEWDGGEIPREHREAIGLLNDPLVMGEAKTNDVAGLAEFLEGIPEYKGSAKWIRDHADGITAVPDGHMYQVQIDATPDELLDWDKPLSEQSEKVQEALTDLGIEIPDKGTLKEYDDALLDALHGDPSRSLPRRVRDISGAEAEKAAGYGSHEVAAKNLRERGIKGIKYKDGFSRGTEGGTSNYVIFDDRLITIAKKYGIAIPAAAAMLSQMTGEDHSGSYRET